MSSNIGLISSVRAPLANNNSEVSSESTTNLFDKFVQKVELTTSDDLKLRMWTHYGAEIQAKIRALEAKKASEAPNLEVLLKEFSNNSKKKYFEKIALSDREISSIAARYGIRLDDEPNVSRENQNSSAMSNQVDTSTTFDTPVGDSDLPPLEDCSDQREAEFSEQTSKSGVASPTSSKELDIMNTLYKELSSDDLDNLAGSLFRDGKLGKHEYVEDLQAQSRRKMAYLLAKASENYGDAAQDDDGPSRVPRGYSLWDQYISEKIQIKN